MATLLRTDKNGTQYFEGRVECDRCFGKGIYYIGVHNGQPLPSWVDNGVCFKCGGSGKIISRYKVYTPEYEAKLAAKRAARMAEQERIWAEEEAKREAERKAKEEAERIAREAEEAEEAARKAISQHVGEIGTKVDADLVLEKSAYFDIPSFSGFGMDTMHVYTFRDEHGNALVWKTGKCLGYESGAKVHVSGTVKAHNDYKGEKQTVLTRCRVKEV